MYKINIKQLKNRRPRKMHDRDPRSGSENQTAICTSDIRLSDQEAKGFNILTFKWQKCQSFFLGLNLFVFNLSHESSRFESQKI